MGADTSYYVEVMRTVKDVIEVQAVTSEEAHHKALNTQGVIGVYRVTHWQEYESQRDGDKQ